MFPMMKSMRRGSSLFQLFNASYPGVTVATSCSLGWPPCPLSRDVRYYVTSASTISEVYRLHHVPLPPITLQALVSRGPSPPEESAAWNSWEGENEAQIIKSAQLLHHEIPIRLAGRIVDLESLPAALSVENSIVKLRNMLMDSFQEMLDFPLPKTLAGEREFIKMQMAIRKKHSTMQHNAVADAVGSLSSEPAGLTEILDRFYSSRIGIRMLVDQHIWTQRPIPGRRGIIANECCPMQVVRQVVKDLSPKCHEAFGKAPEIVLSGRNDAFFKYIPDHLVAIVTEVLKNAIRNTLKANNLGDLPPIHVFVAGGYSGISIKVSDQGGGIPWDEVPSFWSYHQQGALNSLAYDPVAVNSTGRSLELSNSFGMPIARLYARYFGGELTIMPQEGFGTDAYIHLNRLTDDLEVK